MRRQLIATLAGLVPWLWLAPPAAGQAIERIGDFRDWMAFEYTEGGEAVCYMASAPKKAEGDYTQRGDIFVIVTHRPAAERIGEVSVKAGYPYKEDSTVEVNIGGRTWKLFTSGENAWAPSAEDDRALVAAMRAGTSMIVKGTSSRGTLTTDTYSLLGFTRAYQAIGKACGVR